MAKDDTRKHTQPELYSSTQYRYAQGDRVYLESNTSKIYTCHKSVYPRSDGSRDPPNNEYWTTGNIYFFTPDNETFWDIANPANSSQANLYNPLSSYSLGERVYRQENLRLYTRQKHMCGPTLKQNFLILRKIILVVTLYTWNLTLIRFTLLRAYTSPAQLHPMILGFGNLVTTTLRITKNYGRLFPHQNPHITGITRGSDTVPIKPILREIRFTWNQIPALSILLQHGSMLIQLNALSTTKILRILTEREFISKKTPDIIFAAKKIVPSRPEPVLFDPNKSYYYPGDRVYLDSNHSFIYTCQKQYWNGHTQYAPPNLQDNPYWSIQDYFGPENLDKQKSNW